MMNQGKWFIPACLMLLLLSLLVISPVHAHGGEGQELPAPPAPWVIALIYVQMLLLPVVGLWLAREALAAWWPQRLVHKPEGYER
ncbi:MAG: hypothetical protein RRC07_06190 [Anaerolineae bacterium]|nr:hypothetical protein [Anaerolineae bacterium]